MLAKDNQGSGNKGKPMQIPEPDLFRFWSRVEKTENGCWNWTWGKAKGYGHFELNGKTLKAHRVSWAIVHGYMPPPELVVMHKCDNPACVNPDHLALGTQADNLRDMIAKGRSSAIRVIDKAGRQAISEAVKAGFKRADIARYFKVNPGTITRILDSMGVPRMWNRNKGRGFSFLW